MTIATDIPYLEILADGFEFESLEVARAREQHWCARTPLGLLVLRHAEAREVLRDRRLVMGAAEYLQMHGVESGVLHDWWMNTMWGVPFEDHARLRGLVNRAFSPRMIAGMRPAIARIAERLVAQVPEEECEFVGLFAEPLPALVMCELLGVPSDDYEEFHHLSNDIGLAFSRILEELSRVEAAVAGLCDYVAALIAHRRDALGDDLISALIRLEQDGDRLSAEELHNLLVMLVWAGQDTTARQLGRALVAFAEHPEQWTLLAERPELAPRAVEEVCRWTPQARTPWRFASEDVELSGTRIPAGTWVMISTVAANRDPRAFEDPDRFDISAERRSRHLGFGGGIHNCLGAELARVEIAEGLVALTRRLGPPSVTGPITWRPSASIIHGPEVLPLSFACSSL